MPDTALGRRSTLVLALHCRPQIVVMLRVEVSVAIKNDRHRGVAGQRGDLLRVGAVGNPQRDGGVAEVVNAQRGEIGASNGRIPNSVAK